MYVFIYDTHHTHTVIQAVKYESYHTATLCEFLLEKSLCSVRLAHRLYWLVLPPMYQNGCLCIFINYLILLLLLLLLFRWSPIQGT